MTQPAAEAWANVQTKVGLLRTEIGSVVIGQDAIVEQMLVALLCKGHCLIVGVPGLAKTLLVSTLGRLLGLTFHRIQFTPDLMPMDIIGSDILQERNGQRAFEFSRGPIFANLILADEINRTPPKTQAALLEAMQEKQVSAAGRTMRIEEPFIVYATQNPIEHEGTYPLPEAQLDRFFFCLNIDYPSFENERRIVLETIGRPGRELRQVLSREDVLILQETVLDVPAPEHVLDFALRLVSATRPTTPHADDTVKKYVEWGAGPRASQALMRAAKALALLRGNAAASEEDVREVARPVLRHRVIPNYNATGDGVTVETIIDHLLR